MNGPQDQVMVEIERVLAVTQARLSRASEENIMLEALVNQLREQISDLQSTLEALAESTTKGESSER